MESRVLRIDFSAIPGTREVFILSLRTKMVGFFPCSFQFLLLSSGFSHIWL